MKTIRFILGDQLSRSVSSLQGLDRTVDVVFFAETVGEVTHVRHHKQKIVLVLSAMRHFAEALRAEGINVDYVELNDPENSGSLMAELQRAVGRHSARRVVVTEPSEWRVLNDLTGWADEQAASGRTIELDVLEDDRFLTSHREFEAWASGRKSLRMEYFYRTVRRKNGWLVNGKTPEGGTWNYDTENRKRLPKDLKLPKRKRFSRDAQTRTVIDLVAERFPDHFGDLDEFQWAVTREDSIEALEHFIQDCLPCFGDYQDAMKTNEDLLFHSVISPYINIGLLVPFEVCEAAIQAYHNGLAPLAATEGFVRQIAGWREFVRGVYWLEMPEYPSSNYFGSKRPLPDFYWNGETAMNCMQESIRSTSRNAYAHHIQRLMVTGNFALLAGIDPAQVEHWYLIVYADAFEWVELPNTHGMALYADGGILSSKPYAASGAYINRMSDYCSSCRYNPSIKSGPDACPFTVLYWNFLMVNAEKLRSNPRMTMQYRNLDRMESDVLKEISECAEKLLSSFTPQYRGG